MHSKARWVMWAAIAGLAACRPPVFDLAAGGGPATVSGPAGRALATVGVTGRVEPAGGFGIRYAYGEVAKVALGIFERSTDSSTNPLLGYFFAGNDAATSSVTLTATQFTNLQSALGSEIAVGSADKTALRRYVMRTFTAPLPTSMSTSFSNFPVATDSAPVHAYNVFLAAFDSYGKLIGYKEADLTYSILSLAAPGVTLTAPLNWGGLGTIEVTRVMTYAAFDPRESVRIVAGMFDKSTQPQLGFIGGDTSFDGSGKSWSPALKAFLQSAGFSDLDNNRRYLIREYPEGTGPTGTTAANFTNLPAGASRYHPFLLAVRNGTVNAGNIVTGAALSVTSAATTSTVVPFQTGRVETLAVNEQNPCGITVDAAGTIYIAETDAHKILRLSATEYVTHAGSGTSGLANGAAAQAQFTFPRGLDVDAAGNVFVADPGNHAIRKIAADGTVSTFAGGNGAGFADSASGSPQFDAPYDVAVDAAGTVYVADSGNNAIRKITAQGTVSTLAGAGRQTPGYREGTGTAAWFLFPNALALNPAGTAVFVADTDNDKIRKVLVTTGETSLVAGGSRGHLDAADGTQALLNLPTGIAVDAAGAMYVTQSNHVVRRIAAAAPHAVVTIAGVAGGSGGSDGFTTVARFSSPAAIAVDPVASPSAYVADTANGWIRKIR